MTTPNRIVLISRGRYDELASGADIYPGMILLKQAAGTLVPHNVVGGQGLLLVAQEDALQGGDITQKIASGSVVPFRRPAKGDLLLGLLQNGQNVTAQTPLMSAGDGTLIASTATVTLPQYEITAASANVTNTGTETTFSNGSFSVAAGSLAVGDVLHIRALAVCTAEHSTDTHRVRLYIGTTALADSTAIQMINTDYFLVDLYLTVRSLGATGKIVAEGLMTTTISGTATETPVTLGSTSLDTTAAEVIKVTALQSSASTGNVIALQQFQIDLERAGGGSTLLVADEAVNNSGGTGTSGFNTAAFIRVMVP